MSNLIKGTCICIPSTSVRSCLVKCRNKADLFLFINKWVWKGVHQQVGVERGVATRGAQVVWPMMIVTAKTRQCKIHISANVSNLLPIEAL